MYNLASARYLFAPATSSSSRRGAREGGGGRPIQLYMCNQIATLARIVVNFLLALKDLPLPSESGLFDQRIFCVVAEISADRRGRSFGERKP